MAKLPDLDDTTRKIAERMLRMPPRHHNMMKSGKLKVKLAKKARKQEVAGESSQEGLVDYGGSFK